MPCTKRASSAGPPSPAPLKRRSLDLPAHVGATPGWLLGGMAGCSVDEISAAAALWPAIAQLNDLLHANAHAYAEITVLYRSTITRRPTADVAARLGAPPAPAPRPAHALLAHAVLSAFVQGADGLPPCPSASASLFEVRVPPFLAGWAARHVVPGHTDATRLRMLQINGYGENQPPCGPGHALGEARTAKGFGEAAAKPAAPRERKPKVKAKKLKPPAGPVPPPPPPLPLARPPDAAAAAPPVDVVAAAAAEADFNKKLAALAAASERAERDRARAAGAARATVLDGVPDYSKPAPTLGAALRGETAGAQEGDASSSPSFTQGAGAAVTAVALVAVFLFTSGGGGGGGGGSSARPRPSPRPLSEAERAEVASQLAAFKATLATTPTDAPALRGAAAAASALGEPASVAVDYLQRAADAAPRDAGVWAELGAARLDAGDAKGAVAAYERARAESPDPAAPPLALAAALAAARVDAGDAAAAVTEVAALRAAAQDAGRAYDLGLLQGKLLAEWPRHAAEADAIYEELAATTPDDFRAWLARGALARGTGRAGDAARYFLQARYLAKAEERAAVDAVAGNAVAGR